MFFADWKYRHFVWSTRMRTQSYLLNTFRKKYFIFDKKRAGCHVLYLIIYNVAVEPLRRRFDTGKLFYYAITFYSCFFNWLSNLGRCSTKGNRTIRQLRRFTWRLIVNYNLCHKAQCNKLKLNHPCINSGFIVLCTYFS